MKHLLPVINVVQEDYRTPPVEDRSVMSIDVEFERILREPRIKRAYDVPHCAKGRDGLSSRSPEVQKYLRVGVAGE